MQRGIDEIPCSAVALELPGSMTESKHSTHGVRREGIGQENSHRLALCFPFLNRLRVQHAPIFLWQDWQSAPIVMVVDLRHVKECVPAHETRHENCRSRKIGHGEALQSRLAVYR